MEKCKNCIYNDASIFHVLSESEKDYLNKHHVCMEYKQGEIIYKEGDTPSDLICLSKGKAKIYKLGIGNREQIIRMAKPIGFIGYRALFAGEPYRSTAVALEDCCICSISKESIFKVIATNSDLALGIITYLAKELGFSNKRTVTLTQKHLRGRLAESLLFLKDLYGTENDNATLRAHLSRGDIAHLSNMTTSNVIRTLSNFVKEDILSIDRRTIKVLDWQKLEKISELG